jgi:hypothetical protein
MSSRKEQGMRLKKKPYTKPEVKQVQLKPEEAVLGFCKTTGISGPAYVNKCSNPPACAGQGS